MAAPLGFMSMTNPNPAALAWGVPGGCLIFHYQHGHWNGYEVCPSLSPIPRECLLTLTLGSLFASQITPTSQFTMFKFRVLGVYEYPATDDPEVHLCAVLVQALDESFNGSLLLYDASEMGRGKLSLTLTLP
jgi:hypothetical protein